MVPKNNGPEIVGRVRSGRRSAAGVRELYNINPYAGMGKAVGNAFSAIASLGDKLAEQREKADYIRTLNAAEEEVNRRMQDEVYSNKGYSASGAYDRAGVIYTEVAGKYGADLSGANKLRFEEHLGRSRVHALQRAYAFASTELNRAGIADWSSRRKAEQASYAVDPTDDRLANIREATENLFRLENGGRLLTRESIAEFDRDIADNDGKVKLPSGRVLTIVDEETGGENEISRTRLNEIRANMVAQADAFEQRLSSSYDVAHAARVDELIKQRDLAGAEAYLKQHSAAGAPHPMSASLSGVVQKTIKRHKVVEGRVATADKLFARLTSVPESDGEVSFSEEDWGMAVKYGSPIIDQNYANLRAGILAKYKGDEQKQILARLDADYRNLKAQQKANLSSDVYKTQLAWQQEKTSLAEQYKGVCSMPESPLKYALQKGVERRMKAADKDPVAIQRSATSLAVLEAARPNDGKLQVSLDGTQYDLYDAESLKSFLHNAGFTASDRKKAATVLAEIKSGKYLGREVLQEIHKQAKLGGSEAYTLEKLGGLVSLISDKIRTDAPDTSKRADLVRYYVGAALAQMYRKSEGNGGAVLPEMSSDQAKALMKAVFGPVEEGQKGSRGRSEYMEETDDGEYIFKAVESK